ncbi:MAG: hypothetical protein V1885_01280 [Candidatus Brennerbacteria bacterium]
MIELGSDLNHDPASENAGRVIAALHREMDVVEIPSDNPRFQELLEKQSLGPLTFSERDELNRFIELGTSAIS